MNNMNDKLKSEKSFGNAYENNPTKQQKTVMEMKKPSILLLI